MLNIKNCNSSLNDFFSFTGLFPDDKGVRPNLSSNTPGTCFLANRNVNTPKHFSSVKQEQHYLDVSSQRLDIDYDGMQAADQHDHYSMSDHLNHLSAMTQVSSIFLMIPYCILRIKYEISNFLKLSYLA